MTEGEGKKAIITTTMKSTDKHTNTNQIANKGKEKLLYHQGFYVNVNFLFLLCSCCSRSERVISDLYYTLAYSKPMYEFA